MLTALICTVSIVVLIVADQLIKLAVISNMDLGESVPFISGLLQWTYITNEGASWGLFGGQTIFLVVVTILLIGLLTFFLAKKYFDHFIGKLAYVLIIAGGIGNLIDRVFRSGKVIDYIDVSPLFDFPVFNLADCCVVCGGICLCIFVIFIKKDESKKAKADDKIQP